MTFKKLLIKNNSSILQVIDKLNNTGEKTLIVVDNKNRLLGTISDGDIRRHIKKEKNLKISIKNIFNNKPYTCSINYKRDDLISIFKTKKYDLIPITNKNNKVVDVILWSSFLKLGKTKKQNFDVMILAGGLGKRLSPYSTILPKPLFFYNGSTITEQIIHKFAKYGFLNFIISVNYKKNIIKSYLDNFKPYFNIDYLFESKMLGTAGPLGQISNNQKKSFFLINCDTLISANLKKIYNYHIQGNYLMTIVTAKIDFKIDYGVLEIDKKNKLKNINEKPIVNNDILTGLYVFHPDIKKIIPRNKKFDMNDLILKLLKQNKDIGIYKINKKSWKDVSKYEMLDSF